MGVNRAFIYGDLLIETIAIIDGMPRNGRLHFNRITRSAAALNLQLPATWNETYFNLLIAQHPEANMRARLLIYRSGNGFYLPNSNEVLFQVEYWPLPGPKNSIAHLGVFRDEYKSCSPLANLKSGNALLYVLASQFAAANRFDDVLVLNQHGRIAEATSSNVFWVKNGIVHTPPLSEGPVWGVMREAVMDLASSQGIPMVESRLDEATLADADECFLTNAIQGIVGVESFNGRLFQRKYTDLLRRSLLLAAA